MISRTLSPEHVPFAWQLCMNWAEARCRSTVINGKSRFTWTANSGTRRARTGFCAPPLQNYGGVECADRFSVKIGWRELAQTNVSASVFALLSEIVALHILHQHTGTETKYHQNGQQQK